MRGEARRLVADEKRTRSGEMVRPQSVGLLLQELAVYGSTGLSLVSTTSLLILRVRQIDFRIPRYKEDTTVLRLTTRDAFRCPGVGRLSHRTKSTAAEYTVVTGKVLGK